MTRKSVWQQLYQGKICVLRSRYWNIFLLRKVHTIAYISNFILNWFSALLESQTRREFVEWDESYLKKVRRIPVLFYTHNTIFEYLESI